MIVARDVTDRHRLEFDQGDTEVLRAVMANMHGMVVLADSRGHVRSVNGAVTRLLGHDPELARGRSIIDFIHEDDRETLLDAVQRLGPQNSITMDARVLDTEGTALICEFTVNNLLDDPVVESYVVSAQIATSLADARDRVEFLAEHDSRTGLLNRDGFMRAAHSMMQEGGGLGILVVDIVHFRSVNELYGEPVGDAVLAAVADRIDQIRWADLVTARFGGDEFVLALRARAPCGRDAARARPTRRRQAHFDSGPRRQLRHPHRDRVRGATRSARRIVGQRQQRLDVGQTIHRSRLWRNLRRRDQRSSPAARVAPRRFSDGQIQPFFQPICAADGTITAVEALVRWVHPLRGVLGVGEILPLAQMAGLAEAVDDQVLDQSLAFAVRLAEAGYPDIEVHVNIDPKVMSRPAFGATFLERCRPAGADPTHLVVEITETDLLSPGAASLANMQKLRFAGIHVSIDDFGTGYSSLAHLLELPIDGVKIDRRFVAGIDIDPAATNLTTAILGLSDNLHLTCVAEGVEQPYQRERLAALGCTAFQGWLYAPAVAPDELLAMLPQIVITTPEDTTPETDASPDVQASQRSPL